MAGFGKKNKAIFFVALIALLSLCSTTIFAAGLHGIRLVVGVGEGASIVGEVYYGGAKVPGAKVEIFAPDGEKLGETFTDDQGRFVFVAKYKCEHKVVVTDGGHRAVETVRAEDLPDTLPAYGAEAAAEKAADPGSIAGIDTRELAGIVEDAVARRVFPLERELQDLKDEVRLHDILGGIGYIVGFAGLAFYFLGVRRRDRRKPEQGKD
jgi:nickel transport protein